METSHPARERMRIQQGQTRDKIAYPDPAAAPLGTDAEAGGNPMPQAHAHDPAPVSDYGFAYDIPASEEDNRASPRSQPGWHLWGMMVGCMAAGAAILIILSLQTI